MKKLISLFFVSLLASVSFGQSGQSIRTDFDLAGFGVNIGADKRLIVVRTSLELAGVKTDLSDEGKVFRAEVLKDFSDFDPNLRDKMRIFVTQYQNRHPEKSQAEQLTPFIAMAYSLSKAPELEDPIRNYDVPDDVLEVLDYSPFVRELYRSPGVAARIDRYLERYKEKSEFMEPSARDMVRDVLDYLHTRPQLSYIQRIKIESRSGKKKLEKYESVERFRSFTIVPDLLAPNGNINFLNIKDDYFAIVPPTTDISDSEVRRAYLQFVLDPLVQSETREILIRKIAIKSLLDARRKENPSVSADPVLAVARSLVAAADAREEQYRKERLATSQARRKIALMKTQNERKAVADELAGLKAEFSDQATLELSESYENGAVFAFYFAEKLVGVEQSGFDITGSVRAWIRLLDPSLEAKRLDVNKDVIQRALLARERQKTRRVTPVLENPLTVELQKVEEFVTDKKFEPAESRLNQLLAEYQSNKIETARIYYSLGRMTSLKAEGTEDPEEVSVVLHKASDYYKIVLQTASPNDLALRSSTFFALGRIYEHFDQDDYAMRIYDAALGLGNVPGGAFEEAFEAKKNLLDKKKP